MTTLSNATKQYLSSQPLGRLATAGVDGRPHVVPVSFRFHADTESIDIGGHRMDATKKYRDVRATGYAALVVDDVVSFQPWTARMVEIRGRAETVPTGGRDLGPGFGDAFIRLHVGTVNSFGVQAEPDPTRG